MLCGREWVSLHKEYNNLRCFYCDWCSTTGTIMSVTHCHKGKNEMTVDKEGRPTCIKCLKEIEGSQFDTDSVSLEELIEEIEVDIPDDEYFFNLEKSTT